MLKALRFRWHDDAYELNLWCFLNWRSPIGGLVFVVVVETVVARLHWPAFFFPYPITSTISLLLAMHAAKNLCVSVNSARLGHRRAASCCALLTLAYFMFFVLMAPFHLPTAFRNEHFYQVWLAAGLTLL